MRFLVVPNALLCFAPLAVACSSSSSSGNSSSSEVSSACYGECAAEQKATGCQPGGITQTQCQQLCDYLIPSLTPDCEQKAKASWTCGASATWACGSGENVPVEQGNACDAQNAAYAQCSAPHDGGTGGG
jgi:hypothetical protein